MRKQLIGSGGSLVAMAVLSGLAACSSSNTGPSDGGLLGDSGHPLSDAGQGCKSTSKPGSTYVLIDDMETTTNGPIELTAGITAPLLPGYWFNSGAGYTADGGTSVDTSNPPQMSFAFTALPSPTTTLDCKKMSAHAARQFCTLNGLYDTCGVGFEFTQRLDTSDGGATTTGDAAAGDGGASGPRVTVPFDISRYKAVTFWGKTTTPDPDTGSLHVKISFPDTDTDPRGQICTGGSQDTSLCYNSYATYFEFTTSWQQFTVLLDAGSDGGPPPDNGISIDSSWGYQYARWLPDQVYGINWQAQRNIGPDAGPALMTDIWVDDVYFIQ